MELMLHKRKKLKLPENMQKIEPLCDLKQKTTETRDVYRCEFMLSSGFRRVNTEKLTDLPSSSRVAKLLFHLKLDFSALFLLSFALVSNIVKLLSIIHLFQQLTVEINWVKLAKTFRLDRTELGSKEELKETFHFENNSIFKPHNVRCQVLIKT